VEISRKTDYALRMLAELVRRSDAIVSVRHAAEENGVPYSFARAIQHDLTRAGIVESVRGAHGGMKLAVDPSQTTLLDIVEAVQGPVRFSDCEVASDGDPCPFIDRCNYTPIWSNAARIMRSFFEAVTLRQIVIDGLMPDIEAGVTLVPSRSYT
jgi:Rrf2 family protein